MIPYSRRKLSDLNTLFQGKLLENHTLHSGTYLYSPNLAVPPPEDVILPGESFFCLLEFGLLLTTGEGCSLLTPGEGYSLTKAIKVCAASKGRVFPPFWSENEYGLCSFWPGIGYAFQASYGNVRTYILFQLHMSKKEREICGFGMDFKKSLLSVF